MIIYLVIGLFIGMAFGYQIGYSDRTKISVNFLNRIFGFDDWKE